MLRLHPALAALLSALALPAAAAPTTQPGKAATVAPAAPAPRPPAPASEPGVVPVLHLSAGTGVCAAAHSATTTNDNPCWFQLGVAGGIRLGGLELGAIYEGREALKLLSFFQVRPPSVMVLGATAGWVHQPSERWRLAALGELGWRSYRDFAGDGIQDRRGGADTIYAGITGRAALGLRPQSGRADRLEVSVSVRSDLEDAHATVDGVLWTAGGWSFTMGIGLVSEW